MTISSCTNGRHTRSRRNVSVRSACRSLVAMITETELLITPPRVSHASVDLTRSLGDLDPVQSKCTIPAPPRFPFLSCICRDCRSERIDLTIPFRSRGDSRIPQPGVTYSAMPPIRSATTGTPQDIASSTALLAVAFSAVISRHEDLRYVATSCSSDRREGISNVSGYPQSTDVFPAALRP